jgi:hypothetical protein
MITLIGGIVIGVIVVAGPMLYLRKRKKKAHRMDGPSPIVKEDFEPLMPLSKRVVETAPEEFCDLNDAMTRAVGRAISESSSDLDLELEFPDKCKLFGDSVKSKGTVTIHRKAGDETQEAIRVVGRRVTEIEESLEKRLTKIEAALDMTPEKENAAQPEEFSGNEQGEEVQPVI